MIIASYNPSNPQPSHFTQVVWKSTTSVGCAVKTCNNIFPGHVGVTPQSFNRAMMNVSLSSQDALYYVCEYFPTGNVIGRFP